MNGTRLSEILEIADRLFPFSEAETWDNCGAQVGRHELVVTAIAFSLDPTPKTVQFASESSCQLLLTHHPLILEPIRQVSDDSVVGRTILEAARKEVAIVSLHTNVDAASGGLNDHLASRFGLMDVTIPETARCSRIGNLARPVPVSELARRVAAELGVSNVRVVCDSDRLVQRVFAASGSGMGYLTAARQNRADVMVTGDVRYHAAREALETGMPVIDMGHFGLEKVVAPFLAERFRTEFKKRGFIVNCVECRLESDPFLPLSY